MRLSKLRKAGLFAAAIMLSYTLSAQTEVRKLLLNEAIQLAEENNKTLKESELNKNIASEKYNQSAAIFMPQVDLSYTALFTDNPLNSF